MSDQPLDLAALAEAFQELSRFAMEHAPPRRSVSRQLIEDHLQVDPGVLPVVGDEHSIVERPNLQLALDAWASGEDRTLQLVGLTSPHRGPMELTLSELIAEMNWGPPVILGPVTYSDPDRRRRLLALCGGPTAMTDTDVSELVERLDGVAPAFVKELLRRASLLAALDAREATADDVRAALDELYADTSALTRSVLGGSQPSPGAAEPYAMPPGLVVPNEVRGMLSARGAGWSPAPGA